MTGKQDYYKTLGIDRNADENTIKRAYRKMAKKYHPDMNPGDAQAEQKFKEITEAYNVLSDSEKKKLYDQFGHAAFEEGFSTERTAQQNPYGAHTEFHFTGEAAEDIFGDIFGDLFGGKKQGSGHRGFHSSGFSDGFYKDYGDAKGYPYHMKGQDIETDIDVTFDEAVFGCDKVITLHNAQMGRQSLEVHIPAGIDEGNSIRLKGKGQPGVGGGENGDLFLKVKVGSKAGYERRGMDIYTKVNVPYTTAALGGSVRVHTLYGDVDCKIREGTQSGTKIRLKGKGVVSKKNKNVHGDQYVVVGIQVPKHLNAEAKKKLCEYQELLKTSA